MRRAKIDATASRLRPNGEVEGPATAAGLAPRAHTVFQRPRRGTTQASRPAPTIVRSHTAYLQPSSPSRCTFASHSTANTKHPTLSPSIMTIIWRSRKSHSRSARYPETAAIR